MKTIVPAYCLLCIYIPGATFQVLGDGRTSIRTLVMATVIRNEQILKARTGLTPFQAMSYMFPDSFWGVVMKYRIGAS